MFKISIWTISRLSSSSNAREMKKFNNTSLIENDGCFLSGLQHNPLASLVHLAHNKVIYRCYCIASEAREETRKEAAMSMQ